jgi:glycosyltransferase involved in cell wall biosynthesis
MRILFCHQNFPGQFPHIANHLAGIKGNQVVSVSQKNAKGLQDVPNVVYAPARAITPNIHHYIAGLESAVLNGQAVAKTMGALKQKGFTPDVVIGHAGWGETLYVKDVFPDTKLINYFEFFYHANGADTNFDPEFPNTLDDVLRIRTKNSINLLALQASDAGICPTEWQKSLYPSAFLSKLSVIHEGINTDIAKPNPKAVFTLPNGQKLTIKDKVVTYVARNLEPYRGFHQFMRALPEICQRQPDCHVLIVGGDEISYGRKSDDGLSYREKLMRELNVNQNGYDKSRVYFLGKLPYADYLSVLQISSAHVYLTVPFVLSWSMLEAMAAECVVIASNTAPVSEVINGENGLLVDFFSPSGIAEKVDEVLAKPEKFALMRQNARKTVIKNFKVQQSIQQYQHLIEALI